MGLDAYVNCDCFEKHFLRSEPKEEWEVYVAPDGSRTTRSDELETQMEFDQWNFSACEHESGIAMHQRIGNISLVAALRGVLQATEQPFPTLLSAVLYDGSHCCDWLTLSQVNELKRELELAALTRRSDKADDKHLRHFIETMQSLVTCALQVGKPIVF